MNRTIFLMKAHINNIRVKYSVLFRSSYETLKENIANEEELSSLESRFEKLTVSGYGYATFIWMLIANFTIDGVEAKMKIHAA